jgi:phosphate transport system substrate-binding protein
MALATALFVMALTPAAAGAETLIGSGSTAAQPYFNALFAGYKKVQPSINFNYLPDGGNAGVKDVQNGVSQFAGQSVPPVAANAGTTFIKLFLDGLCIDVNPANKLTNVTTAQLANIFTGTLTSWTQVVGSGLSTTIDAYGRNSTAGTYTFFTTAVLNGGTQGTNVTTLGSDTLVKNAVAQDNNGIGYFGLAYQGSGVKALTVNGIACAPSEIKSLTYPLSRYIWLVIPTSNPNPDVVSFAKWVTTSVAAGQIINSVGGVAIQKVPPTKAQQLAAAIATCKKKPRRQQASCIAAARRKY